MGSDKYLGMSVLQEARQREIDGMGYRARRFKTLWKSKTCDWNWFAIEWGIRWSDKKQIFPIWNSSHNGQRAVKFGLGLWYFEFAYYRKSQFNQNRKLFMRQRLWKFYQLVS